MIQIDRFPHRKLILRLRQIVKQKFQDQGAAKSPAFDRDMLPPLKSKIMKWGLPVQWLY